MSLQRSEQNGRYRLAGSQRTGLLQVGQDTVLGLLAEFTSIAFEFNADRYLEIAERELKRNVAFECSRAVPAQPGQGHEADVQGVLVGADFRHARECAR